MLICYGDESYDQTKSRVFALAGVVGTEAMWARLEEAWVARTGGIPFHANQCESDRGDYKSKHHAENQKLYRDLTGLLAESGLCGWGFAIDLIAQKQVFPEAPDLAYHKCFTEVIEAMKRFATNYSEPVQFVFDSRKESDHNTQLLFELLAREDNVGGDLTFASATDQPRLQVADLMVRETMKALDNQIGPKKRPMRKSWEALYATKRFTIEAIGRDWFDSLQGQLPEMQQQTGLDAEKYRQWLAESGFHHSMTNLFTFIGRDGRRSK